MTNLHERMLPDVRIESATVCIPGGRASDPATVPGHIFTASSHIMSDHQLELHNVKFFKHIIIHYSSFLHFFILHAEHMKSIYSQNFIVKIVNVTINCNKQTQFCKVPIIFLIYIYHNELPLVVDNNLGPVKPKTN